MKKIIKKLNNYKLTSRLLMVAGAIGIVFVAMAFVFYQFSGGYDTENSRQLTAFAADDRKILGMIFFLACILVAILSISCIYCSLKYAFPKEKVNPNKVIPWLAFANGVLILFVTVFEIIIISTEASQTAVGFVIDIIVGFISGLYSISFILPALKCDYYMPALV